MFPVERGTLMRLTTNSCIIVRAYYQGWEKFHETLIRLTWNFHGTLLFLLKSCGSPMTVPWKRIKVSLEYLFHASPMELVWNSAFINFRLDCHETGNASIMDGSLVWTINIRNSRGSLIMGLISWKYCVVLYLLYFISLLGQARTNRQNCAWCQW